MTAFLMISTKTNPDTDGWYDVIDPSEDGNDASSCYFMEGDWFESEIEAKLDENPDAIDVDGQYWLKPIDFDKTKKDAVKEALWDLVKYIRSPEGPAQYADDYINNYISNRY